MLLSPAVAVVMTTLLTTAANAAAPGIEAASPSNANTTFNLVAQDSYITQPDGQMVYSWGYGCLTGFKPTFVPSMPGNACPTMQIPGPTLIVTEGQVVTVNLTNKLPAAAGSTSMLFPGFNVCQGILTGATATTPGTCTRDY